MRIVIVTNGSRGDTEPYAALGRGLAARDHKVRVVASQSYQGLIEDAGLECHPLAVDIPAQLGGEEGQRWLGQGQNPAANLRGFRRFITPMAERFLTAAVEGCADADAIVFSHMGAAGYHVAEAMGVPCAIAEYLPRHPTGGYPSYLVPGGRSLGRLGNRLSHSLAAQLMWRTRRPGTNGWRVEELGLRPLPRFSGPHRQMEKDRLLRLCGYSEAVVPRPRDWPANVRITGYWFLDDLSDEWRPPADLARFLDAGPPPVYVGFGSMVPADPVEMSRVVRDGLRRAGVRGVLLGDPEPSTDDFFVASNVPHSWLFPRMAAIVHHGGAGTTASALRAGVPSVICPFFVDQPFWGGRVHALGAGPRPIPIADLTADALATAVRQAVTDDVMKERAAALGGAIRAENGVETACDLLENWLRTDPPPPGRRRRTR
ncbi:glycosyltransferase [Actinoallomurus vinaceus]|uniref:Glycosyltransferase n=1 Tax=Actinoallomurus vinaceus TaxID=1080074 RepID=A0ABP8UT13_9ACTN